MSLFPQRCKVCGRRAKLSFIAKYEIWERVVPLVYQCSVVCLSCFDFFASAKGVDYAGAISEVIFIGEKASFEFGVTRFKDAESQLTPQNHNCRCPL